MNISKDYKCLVSLYKEFREFIKPDVADGVPDFSASAMVKQYRGLKQIKNVFLKSMSKNGESPRWSITMSFGQK